MTTIPKKTLRYTLLDVESNTQCGVTSHAFPPRWTNEDFFEYYEAGDVDGEYDDADVAVGEYYDDVDNEEECVNDIWWVEHPAASITFLLLKILDWEISDHVFRNVFPGYREVMVLENTHPMLGTCGTLSWQLVEINLRLIVMWRYDGLMLLVMTMTFSPVSPSTSTSATPTMQ